MSKMNTREIVNLTETCRACLIKRPVMKNLFYVAEENVNLLEKLCNINTFEISLNDNLPCYLCNSCEIKLEIAYEFKQQCEKSDHLIQHCLATNNPIEVDLEPTKLQFETSLSEITVEPSEIIDATEITEIIETADVADEPGLKKIRKFPKDDVLKAIKETREEFTQPRRCILCEFIGANRKNLSVHMSNQHPDAKQIWCYFCNEQFEDLPQHNADLHNGKKCKFCDKKFKETSHLIDHLYYHSDVRQYKCSVCLQPFASASTLRHHENTHAEKLYECPDCPEVFRRKVHLKMHSMAHSFNCVHCKKDFPDKKMYEEHKCAKGAPVTHEEDTDLQDLDEVDLINMETNIEVCKKCNIPVDNLPIHTLQCHENETKNNHLQMKCNKCNKLVKNMNKHEQKYHTGQLLVKKHLCTYCGKRFRTAGRLTVHTRTHTGFCPYKCQHCDKAFSTLSHRKTHERTHTGEKPHVCNICHKGFAQQSVLATHMRIHTGRPEQCPMCPQKFCRPSELKVHMRRHTGERPFKCDQCDMAFVSVSNLSDHRKSHSDVRAFQCRFCDKSFKKNSTLKGHLKVHSADKPYKCEHCSFACRNKYGITLHMFNIHGEGKYKCEFCTVQFCKNEDLQMHLESQHKSQVCMDDTSTVTLHF